MYPAGQQTCTRRITHSLKHLIEHNGYSHHKHQHVDKVRCVLSHRRCRIDTHQPCADVVAETKREVGQRAQQQAYSHHGTRTVTVNDKSVDKARKSVYERANADDDTEIGIGYAVLRGKPRHCQREVFPNEIIYGIADHRHQYGTKLPCLILFNHLRLPRAVYIVFCHYKK